jgi:hypothetical protein
MKILTQQIQYGDLVLTIEEGKDTETAPGKKCFTIQDKDNEVVINNIYEDEINLTDLQDCLNKVKEFFGGF